LLDCHVTAFKEEHTKWETDHKTLLHLTMMVNKIRNKLEIDEDGALYDFFDGLVGRGI
jgi:hypothetical protein